MAGGFVPFGQNLQLQSGVPLAKVGTVLAEKLTLTKRLDGGALGGLMQSVIQNNGLSGIMQNPAAALTNAIQGQVPGLVSQLQSMAGGGPQSVIDALSGSGGLSTAMGLLRGSGDNLAGLTNGAQGFFSMIGHSTLVEMAGTALPAAAALSEVTGPLTANAFLSRVTSRLPTIVSAVVSGAMSAADATAWIQAQTYTAGSIVASSAAALAWGEQMQGMISTVASVAGSLAVPPTFDADGHRQEGVATGFQGVLASIVQPAAKAAMDAALAAQIAHENHAPVDTAAMTSLED